MGEGVVTRYDEARDRVCKLIVAGKFERALPILDRMIGERDRDPFALLSMGTAIGKCGMPGVALHLLEKALSLPLDGQPARMRTDLLHNLGIQYRILGRIEDAVRCYHQELQQPGLTAQDMVLIYGNLSGCFINEGRPQECLIYADEGLRYGTSPALHNHRALALLELGRYKEGFAAYEARYGLPEFTNRDYGPVPKWNGKPVRNLVLHGEQGIGDEILFLTMLRKAIPLCEQIVVEATPRLVGLLAYSFRDSPSVRFVGTHKEALACGRPDAWLAIGSLPHVLWPFEPRVYLDSARAYFRSDKPRIGITWRGGTTKTHEYYRNAPISDWQPAVTRLKASGFDVISLQYGEAAEMAQALGIPHDADNILDLHTLAGMIKSCDHVLSVCNTTIHMAGALGVPCTVLVPAKPAWRYGVTGDKSDWYASVSYVRQRPNEEWAPVIERGVAAVEQAMRGGRHADQRAVSAA